MHAISGFHVSAGAGEFLPGRVCGFKSSLNMMEVRFATLSLGEGLGVRLRAFRLRHLRRSRVRIMIHFLLEDLRKRPQRIPHRAKPEE